MPRTALVLAVGLCACAPNLSRAVNATNKGLVGFDVIATDLSEDYEAATAAVARLCQAELGDAATEQQRHDCLAKKHFAPEQIEKAETAVMAIRDAYDLIAEALATIKQNADAIEQIRKDIEAVKP